MAICPNTSSEKNPLWNPNAKHYSPISPPKDGWKNCRLYEYKGFWFLPHHICAYINFYNNFQARDEDCILVTPPKAGTTWIKALVFAVSHHR